MEQELGRGTVELMRTIKQTIDPDNLFKCVVGCIGLCCLQRAQADSGTIADALASDVCCTCDGCLPTTVLRLHLRNLSPTRSPGKLLPEAHD